MTNLSETRLKELLKSLTACPLCCNLNLRTSEECYVCGWHGSFIRDAKALQSGIEDLADRAPDLLEVLCVAASARRNSRLPRLLRALFVRLDCRT